MIVPDSIDAKYARKIKKDALNYFVFEGILWKRMSPSQSPTRVLTSPEEVELVLKKCHDEYLVIKGCSPRTALFVMATIGNPFHLCQKFAKNLLNL